MKFRRPYAFFLWMTGFHDGHNEHAITEHLEVVYFFTFRPLFHVRCRACTLSGNTNQFIAQPLRWRHNGHDSVSNHQPHDCLLKGLFRRRSKKTWKLRVTGLCAGNSPGTGEFPAQMASNAENVSIWWRHHDWIARQPHSHDLIHNTFAGLRSIGFHSP